MITKEFYFTLEKPLYKRKGYLDWAVGAKEKKNFDVYMTTTIKDEMKRFAYFGGYHYSPIDEESNKDKVVIGFFALEETGTFTMKMIGEPVMKLVFNIQYKEQ